MKKSIVLGMMLLTACNHPKVKLTRLLEEQNPNICRFYDGEGNEIPLEAVQALVQDQFVQVSSRQDSLLSKYFYFRGSE